MDILYRSSDQQSCRQVCLKTMAHCPIPSNLHLNYLPSCWKTPGHHVVLVNSLVHPTIYQKKKVFVWTTLILGVLHTVTVKSKHKTESVYWWPHWIYIIKDNFRITIWFQNRILKRNKSQHFVSLISYFFPLHLIE